MAPLVPVLEESVMLNTSQTMVVQRGVRPNEKETAGQCVSSCVGKQRRTNGLNSRTPKLITIGYNAALHAYQRTGNDEGADSTAPVWLQWNPE
jgi:hypothetical protein